MTPIPSPGGTSCSRLLARKVRCSIRVTFFMYTAIPHTDGVVILTSSTTIADITYLSQASPANSSQAALGTHITPTSVLQRCPIDDSLTHFQRSKLLFPASAPRAASVACDRA